MTRAERAAPLVAGLILALPVAIAPFPPMLDLPLHEAAVAILRHFGDAAMFPPGLYRMNLGHPNQLFHLASWALSYAMPVAVACRLVVALGVLAVPLAAARLADHVGASRWTAVLASPIALGWLFILGLVANLLGLAALVAVLPALDRFVDRPTARGVLAMMGACVLLYFAHEAMLFVFAGALVQFALLRRAYRPRDVALWSAPLAFAVAITLAQLKWQATLLTASEKTHAATRFTSVARKIVDLPESLFAPFDAAAALFVFALVAIGVATFAAARWRASPGARVGRWELLAASLFVAYLAFPLSLNGANLVHQRFLAPAFVLACVCCGRGAPVPRLAPLVASFAPVAVLAATWPAFLASSDGYRDVVRLSRHMERGSAVALVEILPRDASPESDLLHQPVPMFSLVERGGRYLYSFIESPISPVLIDPAYQWNEPIARMWSRMEGMCPSYDLSRFRYVLVYLPTGALQIATTRAFAPDAKYVARSGSWVLYESTHAVVSLLSPDGPGPGPTCPGGKLIDRVNRASDELRARAAAGEPIPALPPEE